MSVRLAALALPFLAACPQQPGKDDSPSDSVHTGANDTGRPDSGDTDSGDTGQLRERRLGQAALADLPVVRGEAAGDKAGGASAALGDFDGDGLGDLAVGAPGAGAAYVVLGPLTGSLDLADADGQLLLGDDYGTAVGAVGDLDGDGRADLAVGGPNAGGQGAVSIFVGPDPQQSPLDAWALLRGSADSAFGVRVGRAGDFDDDGREDVLVGVWMLDAPGADAGGICVFLGLAGGVRDICSDGSDVLLEGEAAGDWAGYAASGGGDIDGDGVDDLVIGADGTDRPGSNAGSAYVVLGPVLGRANLTDVAFRLDGEAAADNAGHAVALVPDTDGDGLHDVLVGALGNSTSASRAGAAYLLHQPLASGKLARAQSVLRGPATFDHFGYSVAGLGDVDGDGFGDVLVGARFDSTGGADAGAAWLLYGPLDGSLDVSTSAAHLFGSASEEAGYALGGGGDVDGDGLPDALVGAPQAEGAVGHLYLLPGVR